MVWPKSVNVRVIYENGKTRFNRLIDHDGASDILVFAGRTGGFVDRSTLPAGQSIVPGWLSTAEMDAERSEQRHL